MNQNILAPPNYPQRRTFRGRGGPTDRRLPKQNAARRRQQLRCQPDSSCLPQPSADSVLVSTVARDELTAVEENVDVCQQFQEVENEKSDRRGERPIGFVTETVTSSGDQEIENETLLTTELNHLHKRIRNNRSAMSLSATALANLASYQTNVLAACQNTVKEWRSIYKRYHDNVDNNICNMIGTMDVTDIRTDQTWRTTGHAIFELVQQSLQCGPLAGSQPAYFKRCGADTAKLVDRYLEAIIGLLFPIDQDKPDSETGTNRSEQDVICLLGFTEKQTAVIVKWKRNAQKAAERTEALPSRSVLRNQDEAATAKNRKFNIKKGKGTN